MESEGLLRGRHKFSNILRTIKKRHSLFAHPPARKKVTQIFSFLGRAAYPKVGVITFFRTIFPAQAPGRSQTRLKEASSPVAEQQSRRYSRPCSLEMRAQGGLLCRVMSQWSNQLAKFSGDFGRKKCYDPVLQQVQGSEG